MRIDRLELKNFRGFETFEVQLNDGWNVLIGDNGTGKTALLEALTVAAGSFFLGIDNQSPRTIAADDLHTRLFVRDELPVLEPQTPCSVLAEGEVDGRTIRWRRAVERRGGSTTYREAGELREIAESLQASVQNGEDRLLPTIAYYATPRLWLKRSLPTDWNLRPLSRLDGYLDCLEPASNFKFIESWLRKHELAAAQEGRRVPHLDAIIESVRRCIGDCARFWYDIKFDELRAEISDAESTGERRILPFRQLSDGYRGAMGLVADLA